MTRRHGNDQSRWETPKDRRATRTRAKLEETLLALVAEHGYERTSVRLLATAAAVGKSTFYEHFRDKDAVLASRMARLANVLRAAAITSEPCFAFLEPLFEHVSAHRALGTRLRKSSAGALVLARFTRLLRSFVAGELVRLYPNARPESLDFASEYVTGSLGALLEAQSKAVRPHDPHAAARMFRRLVLPGLEASLEVPHPPN